jgi:hypothetical protein
MTMKKLLIAPALVLCAGIFAQTSANAADVPTAPAATAIRPMGPLLPFVYTTIKGEIKVPSTFSSSGYGNGPTALGGGGFGCGNLVIVASSKATKPRPANYPADAIWMSPPVWTRSAAATGTWSSGTCHYELHVPGGQDFHLDAGTAGTFACDFIEVGLGPTPYLNVPKGQTKVQNLTVSAVTCGRIG